MSGPEADFVIIPPADRAAEFAASADRLTAWMASEFPDVHFLLVPPNELSGDEAVVVPILGGVGEGDAVQMRRQPSAEFVQAIRRRAAAFDPRRSSIN